VKTTQELVALENSYFERWRTQAQLVISMGNTEPFNPLLEIEREILKQLRIAYSKASNGLALRRELENKQT
jgi:hypothetical protein